MPGPPPKRDAERRRRNKDAVETITVNLDETLSGEIEIPAPPTKVDEETGEITNLWHPIAEDWYLSLTKSGQAIFYEASDWSTAYLLAESLSRDLKPQPIGVTEDGEVKWAAIPLKGASLNAYLKGMSSLMTTEGERRRMRIELERKKQRDAAAGEGGNVIPITQQRDQMMKEAE